MITSISSNKLIDAVRLMDRRRTDATKINDVQALTKIIDDDLGNYPGLFWAGNQAVTTLRMVWNLLTPGLRRAVSMTVRIPASPWAAHIVR